MFTFIIQTPEYGIATIDVDKVKLKNHVTIATCKAVEHLVSGMWSALGMNEKRLHNCGGIFHKKILNAIRGRKGRFCFDQ